MNLESLASQGDGLQTYVDEDFRAAGGAQADRRGRRGGQ